MRLKSNIVWINEESESFPGNENCLKYQCKEFELEFDEEIDFLTNFIVLYSIVI